MNAESEAFRQLSLPSGRGYIVSLSGSIPMCEKAREHMRRLGSTIYIDVTADDIIER